MPAVARGPNRRQAAAGQQDRRKTHRALSASRSRAHARLSTADSEAKTRRAVNALAYAREPKSLILAWQNEALSGLRGAAAWTGATAR